MLEIAKRENIELAVMMDASAACGSQVIYDGNRFSENKIYQIGAGVSAAQLMRSGFKVISQRRLCLFRNFIFKNWCSTSNKCRCYWPSMKFLGIKSISK